MKAPAFKPNRNLLFIVVALGLGALAAFVAVRYVQSAVAARTKDVGQTVAVAVPKSDMAPGTVVTTSDLAVREVPADLQPADAVTPENVDQFSGRMLRAPVRQGAPLGASALVPLYDQFSRVIKPGAVGYTLPVDETNSISGMIAPGDHVDILLTVEQENAGSRVIPLLENINVLATGNRVGDTPVQEDQQGFSNITLELSPQQAERLTVAAKAGAMRVMLRQVEDRNSFGLNGMTQKELLGTAKPGGSSGVEFIIGGKG
ncbi:pilus assembly protein CpaB [Xanthomonas sacchari]|uniref:Flp pilus assembly protein CpaB n=1 Tax=Xanthomonas sacchari TaxID=56458 RepID=UPI0020C258F5|nr:Flp pilus assembly protein CpaB [Xanthomonas sacchari]MDQ1091457.1 pilus assembly protein CpaB [Xanthomonas sacchari]